MIRHHIEERAWDGLSRLSHRNTWLTNNFNITINEESLETKLQNITFEDRTALWDYTVDSRPDETFGVADSADASLDNFFSRPIRTRVYAWGVGDGTFFQTFNPWQDFFENPRVINRISNYNLLRCKLKVRVIINGTSFHYGRIIASYQPLHQSDNVTRDRGIVPQDTVAASQRPHVYIDPTTSQGGTLSLPFFYYKNALKIPNSEWREMGLMSLRLINTLKHANDANDPVTISVFVWAEEVSLSIPTANTPGTLVPQALGERADEYSSHPISHAANVVAGAASQLTSIPPIAPYARATMMASSSIAALARAFGYSRPANLQPTEPFTPRLLGNLANTNMPDLANRLTVDCKQELTVDSRTVGLGGVDEMALKSIATRESYLTSFAWPVSASVDTLLWNTEVSPVLWNTFSDELHFPACCFATLPFSYWRGTVRFRFQIVASNFHKARLKISYDPSYPVTKEFNTNYIHIVDIAKERDFTIDVGWGSERAMVGHAEPGIDPVPYATTPLGADPGIRANGIMSVYVLNELAVPNSVANNDIAVNVFVSVGDDFEVYEPSQRVLRNLSLAPAPPAPEGRMVPQAMADTPDADMTTQEDSPMMTETTETLAQKLPVDWTDSVYFGDPIPSFRQMLKRYNYHSIIPFANTGDTVYFRSVQSDFPYYRGYVSAAILEDVNDVPCNFCQTTLLNYLTPAYGGWRGSMRSKYVKQESLSISAPQSSYVLAVSRNERGTFSTTSVTEETLITQAGSRSQRAQQVLDFLPHGLTGMTATSDRLNPVVEAEFPYYQTVRFTPAKTQDITSGGFFQGTHRVAGIYPLNPTGSAAIHRFISTGEDFSLFFFLGSPVWFFYTDPEPSTSF